MNNRLPTQFSVRPRPVDLSQENRGYVNIRTFAKAFAWISVGTYCVGSMTSTHTVSTGPGAAVFQAVKVLQKSNETVSVLRNKLNPIIEESQSELKQANHHAGNIIDTANETAQELETIKKDNNELDHIIKAAMDEQDPQIKVEKLQTALEIIGNQTDAIQQAQEGAKNIQNDGQEIH